MTYFKISIVTPSYNLGGYLEQTIDSVLSQGYPELEYIIIDGGSTDNSVEIIRKYEKHLAWWVSEPDNGMYDALSKGFSKSSGEIMGWINSDDCYYPDAFATLNKLFSDLPEIQWVTGAGSIINEDGLVVKTEPSQKWSKYLYYIGKYGFVQQESTFWKRGLWQQAGGRLDTMLNLAGDMELWARFFRYQKLYSVPIPLGKFRRRREGNAAYSNKEKYKAECDQVISRELKDLDANTTNDLITIKRRYKILKFLEKSRILNHKAFKKYYINPLLDFPEGITFDRQSQQFKFVQ